MTIDLSNQKPFASGANRHCYRHPHDASRCLKTLRPQNIEARFQRQAWPKKLLGRARIDDNRQEQQAYSQAAIRKLEREGKGQTVWQHLPRFFGTEMTSQGLANASEMIFDRDGAPGMTLEHYLKLHGFDAGIQQAVERFANWLRDTGILTRNLLPHNLVISDINDRPELFLVDGLGAPSIPDKLAAMPAWRNRYIDRKVRRFHLRIQWELGNRSQSWETSQRL